MDDAIILRFLQIYDQDAVLNGSSSHSLGLQAQMNLWTFYTFSVQILRGKMLN